MVCVLDPKDVDAWLDPENDVADELVKPACPDDWLEYYVTTGWVNTIGNEVPECTEKGPPGSELPPPPPKEKKPRKKKAE